MYPDPRRTQNQPLYPPKKQYDSLKPLPPQTQPNYRSNEPPYRPASQSINYKQLAKDENSDYIPGKPYPSYSQQLPNTYNPEYNAKPQPKAYQEREPLTVRWTGTYNPDMFVKKENNYYPSNKNQGYKENAILIDDEEDSLVLSDSQDSIIFDDDDISIINAGPKNSQSGYQDDKIKKTNKNSMKESSTKEEDATLNDINLILKLANTKLSSTAKSTSRPTNNQILDEYRARLNSATPGPKISPEGGGLSTAPSTISKRASPVDDSLISNNNENSRPLGFEQKSVLPERSQSSSQFIDNVYSKAMNGSRQSSTFVPNGANSSQFSSQNKFESQIQNTGHFETNGIGNRQFSQVRNEMPNSSNFDMRTKAGTDTSSRFIPFNNGTPNNSNSNGNTLQLTLPPGMKLENLVEQARNLSQNANQAYQYNQNQSQSQSHNGSYHNNYNNNNNYNNYNNSYNQNGYYQNMPRRKQYNNNDEDQLPPYRNRGPRDFNREKNRNFNNNSYNQNNSYRKPNTKHNYFTVKSEDNNQDRQPIDSTKLLNTPLHDFKHRPKSGQDFLERGSKQEKPIGESNGLKSMDTSLMGELNLTFPSDTGGKSSPLTSMYKNLLAKSKEMFQTIEIGLATLEQKIDMDIQEQLGSGLYRFE